MKIVKYRAAALLLVAAVLFGTAGCRTFENETGTSSGSTSAESSKSLSSIGSEYPSSQEELSSQGSSSLSSIVSKIEQSNVESKASSQTSSKPPASSKPPTSTPSSKLENSSSEQTRPPVSHDTMKAVWLSYLEFQSFQGSSETGFTAKIQSIFNTIAAKGLNTVIVQVRPHGDSFYESAYYPWSKCVSGTMGLAVDYDPLAIMVREAHSRGLSIHAWINPYRTMTDAEFSTVPDSYAIKQWYNSANRSEYMIQLSSDQRWWLKPGNREVQQLIINGAKEIVQKYAVDGIHIDDYFYGASPSNYGDSTAQAKANTTAMVKGLYDGIKSVRSAVQFGVSPLGGFTASNSLPNSDLNYLSTDLALWCSQPGYLDYVMPQIYWEYTHATQPFTMTLNKWENFVTEPSVALYVGLAPYKLSASEIESQAADSLSSARASGYCLFRYDHIHSLNLP